VDAQRMTYMGFQVVSVLYAPIQIIIGLTLLYNYIGPSFLVGLGVMIVLMLFTLVFTKISTKGNDQLLKAKDARMKMAEEILQIIKYIKVNAL
jgi:ABC-type bacteriocin/lantibiotic exporter with double-glycine peptidase domain